ELRLALGEAEEVAGVVGEHGGGAVGLLFGSAFEVDALALQLLVGGRAVGGVEDAAAEHSLGYQGAELCGGFGVENHAGLGFHQGNLEIGLAGDSDRDPAEITHAGIGAQLETELVDVEVDGAVVVEDVDGGVGKIADHLGSPFECRNATAAAGCSAYRG